MLKKIAVCSVALMLLTSTLKPASAVAMLPLPPPAPPPPASSAALGVGGGIAIGLIATVALLCAYDLWLKINGLKNWDGSPKVVQHHHHRHH